MVSLPLTSEHGARLLLLAARQAGTLRSASRHESAIHKAADAHVAKLSVAIRYAFAMGRKAMRPLLVEMKTLGGPDQPRDEQGQWTSGGSINTTSFDGKLSGIHVPPRERNQVYLVRYSKHDETSNPEGLGEWSHAHADVNVGIDASAYYSKTKDIVDEKGFLHSAPHEGFIYIGRGDKREVLGQQASNRGRGNSGEREVLNALIKDNLDVVINVLTGEKVYERKLRSASLSPADIAIDAIREALEAVLPKTLRKVLVAGGEAGLETLGMRHAELRTAKDTSATSMNIRFDAKNPHVINWADKHAAELITQIAETTREAINNAVAEHQETGDWDTYYDEILAAVGDENRADLIARHETMLTAGEGQRQAWDQAVDEGLLTGAEQRVWIVTPDERLCDICAELEDENAPLGGEYAGGYDGPPAHVQCRCTEGIA